MSACLKGALGGGASLGHAVFFRTAVTAALAAIAAVFLRAPVRGLPVRILLVRTLLGGSAMVLGFWAVGHLPLGDAEVLRRTSPLFVVVLAWPLLGERPGPVLVLLVLTALTGAALVARPTLDISFLPAAAGLSAGALGAGAYLCLRHMAKATPVTVMVAFFTGCMALGSAPFALRTPVPEAALLLPLLGAGIAGTLGQLLMTAAYRYAPAGVVATVGYLAVAFATLFGLLVFRHVPDGISVLGAALIAASCVLISLRRGGAPGRGGLDGGAPRSPPTDTTRRRVQATV
jgi:drug/metabolite transporter (DMT)-like permease